MATDGAATEVSDEERRAFVAEATAFLEANAERRPTRTEDFRWGTGVDEIGIMGGKDDGKEDERLAAARAWRAKVFDAGFGWLGGPVEYGGGGRHPELDHDLPGPRGRVRRARPGRLGRRLGDGGAGRPGPRQRGRQAAVPAPHLPGRAAVLAAAQRARRAARTSPACAPAPCATATSGW